MPTTPAPIPASFIALMRTKYEVPFVRPVSIVKLVRTVVVSIIHVEPLVLCSTRYPVIVPAGADQLRIRDRSPGVITRPLGAPGSARAVTVAGVDAVPIPALVTAETRNKSGIPTSVAV